MIRLQGEPLGAYDCGSPLEACLTKAYNIVGHDLRKEYASVGISPLFSLGRVVATGGALKALVEAGQLPHEFLGRHIVGDWGDLDEHDRTVNDDAVLNFGRILSAYALSTGVRIWLITEADRSASTLLLPDEY